MRRFTSLCLLAAFFLAPPLLAAEPAPAPAATNAEQSLKENPDDVSALNAYMLSNLRRVSPLMATDPDEAEKVLASMQEVLQPLEPTTEEAKQLHQRALEAVEFYQQQLEVARTSREDLEKKLTDDPDDVQTIQMYLQKTMQELFPLASSQPDEAQQQLTQTREFVEGLTAKVQDEEARKVLAGSGQLFARLTGAIERAKKLQALTGADAAPLKVEAWVNGDPLTDEDLKGKVIMLDFWAVWCGPCIATFPHLRQWHEEYADQGLIIIGLTRYYNYRWDEEADRAVRSQEEVSPEQEQEMLAKFAASHDLEHRFALQEGTELSEFYGVTGIPHVVLIDRAGKVRMMRVGSGEQAAKDLEQMIEELIAEEV